MEQIKIPKDVMELLYEADACQKLAYHYAGGWLPSIKAVYYTVRARKAERLAYKMLHQVHPKTATGVWLVKIDAGTLVNHAQPPAKPKAPRKTKPVAPTTVTTQGETK